MEAAFFVCVRQQRCEAVIHTPEVAVVIVQRGSACISCNSDATKRVLLGSSLEQNSDAHRFLSTQLCSCLSRSVLAVSFVNL